MRQLVVPSEIERSLNMIYADLRGGLSLYTWALTEQEVAQLELMMKLSGSCHPDASSAEIYYRWTSANQELLRHLFNEFEHRPVKYEPEG